MNDSHPPFEAVWATLEQLRAGVQDLERWELDRVDRLRGHQTVDDREAIRQSFAKLAAAILEIEETLATIGEATGEIGKL
ncbi:hypothetical protein EGJ27_01470 [Pseudomonas sp. v388]|uniref:hypothetical protein n=1 Tax=Pseudomonas sp. v388 TaxID=2479849 RepID=UPI000F782776|nr:hypothetical protein [Pseudomonas sp. v388]RRV10320.1 hypothetical protein EGJ27_01470 [Pseudomonas sp. v388]